MGKWLSHHAVCGLDSSHLWARTNLKNFPSWAAAPLGAHRKNIICLAKGLRSYSFGLVYSRALPHFSISRDFTRLLQQKGFSYLVTNPMTRLCLSKHIKWSFSNLLCSLLGKEEKGPEENLCWESVGGAPFLHRAVPVT